MGGSDLPDDPRGWPDNPFELLGVSYDAGDADIKRAYTRLIRRFKPEHHPEQFRLVREAYEFCKQRTAWFRFPSPRKPEPPQAGPPEQAERSLAKDVPPPPAEDVGTDRRQSLDAPPDVHPEAGDPTNEESEGGRVGSDADFDTEEPRVEGQPTSDRVVDRVEQLWATAVNGAEAEAYAGLVDQSRYEPDRVDVLLRLYWLLTLNPDLDPVRTRHHWLAAALVLSNLRGPAVELYRRELEADPLDALKEPYDRLLTNSAAVADLTAVVRFRSAAAGRANLGGVIVADLTAIKTRVRDYSDTEWLGLIVTAAVWSILSHNNLLKEFWQTELADLKDLELSHGSQFDRLDDASAFAVSVMKIPSIPPELHAVVRTYWVEQGVPRPQELGRAVEMIGAAPYEWLFQFDHIYRESGPIFLALFGRAVERYVAAHGAFDEITFPPELIRSQVDTLGLRYFDRTLWYEKTSFGRVAVLKYLILNCIDPMELAACCGQDSDPRLQVLGELVRNDLSMRVVWLTQMAARV
ncbi:J domain-containing protein [Fimbriiglobus ruber]|uniref:J domain-containing protein n=1 Tax=Fimbriiglobus ruber TaxID=1908690 RepID=A0A225E231_9BACT|nr:hypothetical protein [Fimbriiglobus ruber]OWK47293.1 hypothetical protein FRUB_00992 [Fimbriiglobus ruber]